MTEKSPSFADLFETAAASVPPRARVHVGDKFEATVVQVGKESVFVELPGRRQGYFDAAELRDADGKLAVKAGDRVAGHVVEVSADGEIRLGRTLGKPGNLAAVEQARDSGIAVEGKVSGLNKGGLEVDLDGLRAFCPISQVELRFVQDPSIYLGKSLRFRVTEVRDGGKGVVLSRRALLEEEAREAQAKTLATLAIGQTVRGAVTSVREFGAFVDLGGVEGLIPTGELSYDRVKSAGDVLSPGDQVEVQVRDVKPVTPQRPGDATVKITLSLKALAADPWEQIDTITREGMVVEGVITRVMEFGGFVRLGPGIEGLLHVSELGGKVQRAADALRPGQAVNVVVQRIDRSARKISLTPAPEGLGAGATVTARRVAVGSVVTGTVDHVETFGVFIQLEGTKGRAGRGLIPNAELATARGSDTRKQFPEGMVVTAKVLETGEGRLRLSIKALKDDEERAVYEGYRETSAAPARLGTFGDLLAKAKTK
jgi:small subunit ribosomal protein S1